MKKSDLKTGMLIEARNGTKYIVLKDVETKYYGVQDLLFACENGFMCSANYTEDLKAKSGDKQFDIVKVYSRAFEAEILKIDGEGRELLWQREETIEMTLEEACKKLRDTMGKPIKITI